MASWSRRTARRRSTAISCWGCRAAPSAWSRTAGRRATRLPSAYSRSTPNCATGIWISANSLALGSNRIGNLSSVIGSSDMQHMLLPRRRIIAASIAGAAALSLPAILRAAALLPTPAQTEGPFYPLTFPADSDNDLVHVVGHAEAAKGTPTRVTGRILDAAGRPVTGARVEIWQCDANGRYHNVRDGDAGRPRDENFPRFRADHQRWRGRLQVSDDPAGRLYRPDTAHSFCGRRARAAAVCHANVCRRRAAERARPGAARCARPGGAGAAHRASAAGARYCAGRARRQFRHRARLNSIAR